MAGLVKLLLRITQNMQITEPRQRHRFRLTPNRRALLTAPSIPIKPQFIILPVTPSIGLNTTLSRLVRHDRTHTVLPVVLSVMDLDLLHYRPVVIAVAFPELFHVVGTASEDILAGEAWGFGKKEVLWRRDERVGVSLRFRVFGVWVWGFARVLGLGEKGLLGELGGGGGGGRVLFGSRSHGRERKEDRLIGWEALLIELRGVVSLKLVAHSRIF